MSEHGTENEAAWIEVEVTIETTTEEKATYKVDRRDFNDWAGDVAPADLPKKIRAYLKAGDDWEVCSEIYEASRDHDVVDCQIQSVRVIPPSRRVPRRLGTREDFL